MFFAICSFFNQLHSGTIIAKGGENMNNKIIGAVIIALLIIGAIFLLSNKSSKPNTTIQQPVTTQATPKPTSTELTSSEIVVTATGFQPKTITVAAGTRVVWNNRSGKNIAIASDDHPTHLKYPLLNIGKVKNGASAQLIFDKPGTYGYHNHIDPSQTGTIIVR